MTVDYGSCGVCGNDLSPVWYQDKEIRYDRTYGTYYPTGRKKMNCSHLVCENCGKQETVDDSFDEVTYR